MEELSEAQFSELMEDLRLLQLALQGQLAAAREGTRPVDLALPIGRLSRMDAMQQQSMAAANRRSVERRLQQVAAALVASAEGEFGMCRSCGEPVGYPRLKSRPEAPLCVVCQGARERER